MIVPTQRVFKDVETGQDFRLYTDDTQSKYQLITEGGNKPTDYAKGTQVNGFYICAHTGVTIKINGSKEVSLPRGTFYNIKEDEVITHKKFIGFKKFTKVKEL